MLVIQDFLLKSSTWNVLNRMKRENYLCLIFAMELMLWTYLLIHCLFYIKFKMSLFILYSFYIKFSLFMPSISINARYCISHRSCPSHLHNHNHYNLCPIVGPWRCAYQLIIAKKEI